MATITIDLKNEMVSVSAATRHLALKEELDQLILSREIDQRQSRDSGRRITLAELDEQYGQEG